MVYKTFEIGDWYDRPRWQTDWKAVSAEEALRDTETLELGSYLSGGGLDRNYFAREWGKEEVVQMDGKGGFRYFKSFEEFLKFTGH